jgi:hypothetical protein
MRQSSLHNVFLHRDKKFFLYSASSVQDRIKFLQHLDDNVHDRIKCDDSMMKL